LGSPNGKGGRISGVLSQKGVNLVQELKGKKVRLSSTRGREMPHDLCRMVLGKPTGRFLRETEVVLNGKWME
jgi:hypothetical protein